LQDLKPKVLEGWVIQSLAQFISLEYGAGLTESERKPGNYPVFGSNGIIGYHNKALISGPGIVVGRKGSIGKICWADTDFWPIDTTYYISLKQGNVSLRWIYYMLNQLQLSKLNAATGVPGLNRNQVYAVKWGLPPFREQQKIASILSKVDELIQKTDQVIEQTQRLKKGLIQRLLTKSLSQNYPDNFVMFSESDYRDAHGNHNYIGNYSKGLPHHSTAGDPEIGEVDPDAYRKLLHAVDTGDSAEPNSNIF
jgi:type I restriction enzyme, S subunit